MPSTTNRPLLYGTAYAVVVGCIVVLFASHSLDAVMTAKIFNHAHEYFVFAAIAFLGALAIILGASVGITASAGTLGSLIVLTIFQQDPLIRYLALGAVLFAIGMYGMVVSRNAVRVLMSIELMLNAVNINLVAFARYVDPAEIKGQAFAIFILTVAAAEAAVGLAIVLSVYRNAATVDMDRFTLLKW